MSQNQNMGFSIFAILSIIFFFGSVQDAQAEGGLIFTMITMPPDKIDYIHENWIDGDMVSSERIQALNLFPEKTRAIIITTIDNLDQAILQAKQTGIEYVVYNNEPSNGSSSTPPEEIEDAPNVMRIIADRVHDEGLKFVSAPSFGLMIKIVNDVDWEAVNPEIVGLQLQRAPSSEQIIEQFNEKSGIIRQQDSDTLFIVQFNPEWQTIDDVKHVLANTNGEIGGISVVCNFDSCTEEYLDEILALRYEFNSETPNNSPTANDDSYNTLEDTALNVSSSGVLFNDTDPESDSLTAVMDTNVTHGTLLLNSNGIFSYTPNTTFAGNDIFTYHAFDGIARSGTATVTITVNPVNDPPTANDDSYNTLEDTALNVSSSGVLFNDIDPESDSLTAVMDTNVTHGTLLLNSDGSFSYTPNNSFAGNDIFTYHAFDGVDSSNTATVTITVNPVNDPPTAPPTTKQLFFDDFEDDLGNWTESGELDWKIESETKAARSGFSDENLILHADDCDTECTITMTNSIDLSAHANASLSFWRFVDRGLDPGEYLKVEAFDGVTWNELFFWSHRNGDDSRWHQETIDLTDYLGVLDFNLRFSTHESHFKESVEIDDVLIEGS